MLDRSHPGYEPSGTTLGDFILHTQVGVTETYNTNLFATHADRVADERTALTPDLLLQSRWARNLLQLDIRGDLERYFDRPNEAINNGVITLTGRYDGPDFFELGGVGDYSHLTEPRASTLSPRDAVRPIQYDVAHVNVYLTKDLERLKLGLTTDAYQTTFQNGRTEDGGTVLESIYDTQNLFVDASAAYVVDPDVVVLTHVVGNERHFPNSDNARVTDAPVDRDSSGLEATVGVNLSLTHLIRGEVLIGYIDQGYHDSSVYRPVAGPSAHIRIVYLPTGLTTVSFTVDRKVNDAQDPVAVSYLGTGLKAEVDHELYRNVVLSGSLRYEKDSYAGVDRRDILWEVQSYITYLINRRFSLKLLLDNFDVASQGVARIPSYNVQQLSVALVARF